VKERRKKLKGERKKESGNKKERREKERRSWVEEREKRESVLHNFIPSASIGVQIFTVFCTLSIKYKNSTFKFL
jgi:hypothetical protein